MKQIEEHLSISILGFPKWFLGVRISKDDSGKKILDHSRAVTDILKKFDMEPVNFIKEPLSPQTQLMPLDDSSAQTSQPYGSRFGSLMYMMTSTKPDLTVSFSLLSQFMSNPSSQHWDLVER